jgi:hypothetical protein
MSVPSGRELNYICELLMNGSTSSSTRAHAPSSSRNASTRRKKLKREKVVNDTTGATEARNDIDALSRPGSESTKNAAHCEACDVWVANKPGNWAVHTAGIRHRRQVLSIRENGVRGGLVVSTFEYGNQLDACNRSTMEREQKVHIAASPPSLRLQQYKTSILVEILNAHGPGLYRKAFQDGVDDMLATLDGELLPRLDESSEDLETPLHTIIGLTMADSSHSMLQSCLVLRMNGSGSALHTALWSAAIRILLCEIGRKILPERISIHFPARMEDMAVEAVYRQALKHILLALRELCSRYAALSSLEIYLHDLEGGQGEQQPSQALTMVENEVPLMEEGLCQCVDKVRMTLALSQHKRVGGGSLLCLLPIPTLHRIMDFVAPLTHAKEGSQPSLTRSCQNKVLVVRC